MGLFFSSPKPKATPASSKAHHGGLVTKRELEHEVMARLRRDGLNRQEREIAENAIEGHMDKNGFASKGMDEREADKVVHDLRQDAHHLGFESKDIDRIKKALDDSM